MQPVKNQQGYVVVFVTLMIVLLMIMVGMGLDTGHLAYVRSQGQPAVDSAALAAASAIPSGNWSTVTDRAAKFNPGGTNPFYLTPKARGPRSHERWHAPQTASPNA